MRYVNPVLLVTVLTFAALTTAQKKTDDGWVALFNGKDLSGWKNPYDWGEAKVIDGEIHLKANKKFFLVTEKAFGDFVFEGEVHLPEGKANSGFMFRCNVKKNNVFGYQAEVDGSKRRWSGGLYDEGRRGWIWPSKKGPNKKSSQEHFKKPEIRNAFKRNDWNKYRITCRGDRIRIEVNGVLITDVTDGTDAKGPIGIQHHGEKGQTYRFRNLRIRPLGKQNP